VSEAAEYLLAGAAGLFLGIAAVLAVLVMIRRIRRRPVSPQALPEEAITTARAYGGYAVIVTPYHVIVHSSELADTLPLASEGVLIHPELADLADEAWSAEETITRPYVLENLGPLHHVVVQAAILDRRWVLLAITDRTDQVRTEETRRDFISNIGHELRTPITAVDLIAETLDSAADDVATVLHFASRLRGVAEHMGRLTEDMIALSIAQEGGARSRYGWVDVDSVVEVAIQRQTTPAEGKGIDLRLAKRSQASVWGDFDALTTAVENLISNAINYSPDSSPVTVTTRVDHAEGTVNIAVIDQGIGIDTADIDRIFERFYRTDSARSQRTGGTGLGLSIVKHTALSHGGTVGVVSGLGAGSTFTLTLPLDTSPSEGDPGQVSGKGGAP
jgi:two-component system sensor histidine kinase SenX3